MSIITPIRNRFLACLLVALSCGFAMAATAGEDRLPRPPELERDIAFWIKVYTQISTSEGYIHDDRNLNVVYRKLSFEPDVTSKVRRDAVDAEREKIQAMLKRLAANAPDLTDDEKAIAAAFGEEASPQRYLQAVDAVRFQLGQSDRFREGLLRSGTWESHIAETFANRGLPSELAILPHVESSFDPTAYSKVGAAGLWQFMRATGRRYLRIDDAVDERLDPFRATEAAAQLLDYNYRLLGSWPLALTAYNHGAAGMRRARDAMGTSDIAILVRHHKSPSFGFASRNFYVSFLAALSIDREPEKYFGNISRHAELKFSEVEMPAFVPLAALEKAVRVERVSLLSLNPALRPTVWDGQRLVPKGYRLRLPVELATLTSAQLQDRIGPQALYAGQPKARSVKARRGDTLAGISRRTGVPIAELQRLNRLSQNDRLRSGRAIRLPDSPAELLVASLLAPSKQMDSEQAATDPPAVVAATPATRRALVERQEEAEVATGAEKAPMPVSANEARTASPSLVPGGAVAQASDPIDYGVAGDNSIRVAAAESLGLYAEWLGVPLSRLNAANTFKKGQTLALGRVVRLDFSKVSQSVFEGRRRAYHQNLQAAYFAGHRIVGTVVHVARRGDSLWSVTQRYAQLPAWLLQQYNPDLDLTDLKAGTEVVVPKVESLSPGNEGDA